MNQNRRRYKRFLISHPAKLVVNGAEQADCHIGNYSEGGLYLAIDNAALKRLKNGQEQADSSTLHAEVQLLEQPAQSITYRVPVRFAFESSEGVGVAFMSPDAAVQSYLANFASTERKNRVRASLRKENNQQPLTELAETLNEYLGDRITSYFNQLDEALIVQEEQASHQHQPDIRHARRMLQEEEEGVKQRFFKQVARSWDQLQDISPAGDNSDFKNQSLELVDEDEFDEWAAVVGVSRRMEGRLASTLHKLSESIAYLAKTPVSNDNNPLSPYRLLWSFKKSLDPLSICVDARRAAYTVFAEQILAGIDQPYHQIFHTLEQQGHTVGMKQRRAIPQQPKQAAVNKGMDVPPQRHQPKTLIETLSSFLGDRKQPAQMDESAIEISSNAAITHALEDMVQGDQRKLSDRIEQTLGGHAGYAGNVTLSPASRQIIEATEHLLQITQKDPRHNPTTRKILRQVQLPLAKAAIEDPAVLNDPQHSSRELLDNLDQLALFMSANDGSMIAQKENEKLESVLGSLEAAGGKADLNEVARDISGLLDECKSTFNTNLNLVLTGCDAEQQRSTASQQVRAFLEQELKGSISTLIDQLLRLGWVGLLVQSIRLGEAETKYLKHYQQVLVLLNNAFQVRPKQAYLTPDKWKKIGKVLRSGFDTYPIFKNKGIELIDKIGKSLEKGSATFTEYNQNRVDITPSYFDQLLPIVTAKQFVHDDSKNVEPQYIRQLNKIQKDDWITEQQPNGRARMLSLAWCDDTKTRYVFVDGSGVKALDYKRSELLNRIQNNQISIIEDHGLPMVERAVERALKEGFGRLRDESDQDSVTGLKNRRAFHRDLNNILNSSSESGHHHILLCMDVDKFTLINDLCGMEGGDHFLARIGGICSSLISHPGAVSRTGDNEFSILLEQCSLERGYAIAESLRMAIENFRFEWAEHQISVTVSIGLTELFSGSGHADAVNHAAHSACAEAKKEGRNRCCCYQHEGEVYAQKMRLAQSVPLIEKALEQNRLELHGQLIRPIFQGQGLSTHHEILLRRLDDENMPGAPYEFILAAEQYERMRAVDRWVVKRFFNWARSTLQGKSLSDLGAFSINLSGQSMSDETLIPFLKELIVNSPIPPEMLAFEITETAMVSQLDQARKLMEEIKALGCQFYLDDFGSGYASYSYLKEFPVDVVKIDGIFVKDVDTDRVSRAMVKSITEVAHHMNKRVIAEYVESESILNVLAELEVDYAQGYSIGYPTALNKLFPI
ncbi:DUF1631 family protein [Sedimenticola selenatireducens]|uniref:DUF1631 family protein n=1 Tax=Sedimenticola selenatireducens TaxID=191960 RepID=A0A557S4A7_9GAMM|nr:DUF1631 family protein [Sedimenticola selenatireducens]TVO72248.1 DUF1631 family protein [Sedimenticola selenatireducens]TVT61299.1 MAG: DUF1631 family protein [Sedimenticola selenatireducens]